jgi:DNA-binding NarL/FixJ family response regulator
VEEGMMIKPRSKNLKKVHLLEVINRINPGGLIQVMLASSSQFFSDGISNIIKSRTDNIKVITEVSKRNIKSRLVETKPQFLLLDNRSFRLNVHNLIRFILEKSPETKVILLSGCSEYEHSFHEVIYINKETSSSELISIINRESLSKGIENGAKKSSVR